MGLGLTQISLQIGYAWILLNLAAIGFFAALFCFEQVRSIIRRRHYLALQRSRAVVCIDQR